MKIKDILRRISVIIFCLTIVVAMSGCWFFGERTIDKIEEGDFLFFETIRRTGDVFYSEIVIIGFSEQGLQKQEIVFPYKISEKDVVRIGNNYSEMRTFFGLTDPINYFENELSKVEKVFIPANIEVSQREGGIFGDTKAIMLSAYPNLNYIDTNNTRISNEMIVASGYKDIFEKANGIEYIEANIQFEINYEIEGLDALIEKYTEELTEYRQNYFMRDWQYNSELNKYRHEVSKNEGIYWIDHLDFNQNLNTIPQNPTREGYTFGGWYFDKEGQSVANLTTIVPNEDGSTLFLYAKWE